MIRQLSTFIFGLLIGGLVATGWNRYDNAFWHAVALVLTTALGVVGAIFLLCGALC